MSSRPQSYYDVPEVRALVAAALKLSGLVSAFHHPTVFAKPREAEVIEAMADLGLAIAILQEPLRDKP